MKKSIKAGIKGPIETFYMRRLIGPLDNLTKPGNRKETIECARIHDMIYEMRHNIEAKSEQANDLIKEIL